MKLLIAGLLISTSLFAGEKIYASFDVVASKESTLVMDVSGIIKNINVDIGSVVNSGDVLAELENSVQKQDLQVARRDLQTAEINLERAKSNFQRYEKVKSVVDEFKLDSFKFDLKSAEASLEKAKAVVEAKKITLDKTYLKAPYDGVISAKNVDIGDGISGVTLTPIVDIISSKSRKLILSFDEKYHTIVKAGNTFTFGIDGSHTQYTTKITKVYPSTDTKTRTLKAEANVSGFKVGLFGDGYIEAK